MRSGGPDGRDPGTIGLVHERVEDYTNIAAIHSVYGMVRVQLAPSLGKITVDYDASRLMKKDVEAALGRYGIPIASPTRV
jgi:hypothetical protein